MLTTSPLSIFFIFVALSFLSSGCEEQADLSRVFLIKEGDHYASPRLVQSMQSNTLTFRATFNETAIYEFKESGFQDSKNKLLGFSDCNSLHHENSARFAWQWYNNQLEIFAYCYVGGERFEKFIGTINLHEENRYQLKITTQDYVFQLNDHEPVTISRRNVCDTGIYYMLWPYFGGSLSAPHDISLLIKLEQ
jgi:hypothetical protein